MVEKVTKWSYLTPFLRTREKLHLLQISRELNQNHATVRKYLNYFEKQGILQKGYQGRLTLYWLNTYSDRITDVLTIIEKEQLIIKCQKNLKLNELVNELRKITSKPLLIFGSSVQNFSKANDIDILTTNINLKVKEIENKLNIQIHLITTKSLKNIKESLRIEIIKKHLIINRTEEIIKWLQ